MNHISQKNSHVYLFSGFIFILTILLFIILTGCSGKGKGGEVDSHISETATAADDIPAEQPADIFLTPQGVGAIVIGMKVEEIPDMVEGLYDSVIPEEGYESNSYLFMQNGEAIFTAYEFTPGTIDVISADSRSVKVKISENEELSLGSPFSKVVGLPGVVAEWENADGEGMWCWRWKGLWFQPDQQGLPENLSRELYTEVAPPSTSSFTPEVKIGYIGTGLPW